MNSGDLQTAVDVGREVLLVAMKLSFPVLIVGLVVGAIISVIQAATQIQEQTLTFIPKMFAIVVALFVMLPWLLTVLVEYTQELVMGMGTWFK